MVLCQMFIFIAILDFSYLFDFWYPFSLLPLLIALSIVIAPKGDSDKFSFIAFEREKAIVERAIQKRSYETMYKTDIKNEAKRLRATTFAVAKRKERKLYGEQQRKL